MKLEERITRHAFAGDQEVETTEEKYFPSQAELQHARADKQNQTLWYIVGIVECLLLLRFLFHLFGAHAAGFAQVLYVLTAPFVAPFQGIFRTAPVSGGYFDTAALLAVVIYALIGMGIAALIDLLVRPPRSIS